MNIINKLSYFTWNIGFVESSVEDIVKSKDTLVNVYWVKHPYKDRFFADPFILSGDDNVIKVLVEDFPYYDKKGLISILTIDRKKYCLLDRKVILEQPFHMSYPFIQRNKDGSVRWIAPEASMSGNLYRYTINPNTDLLEKQEVLIGEPLLDSTIVEYDGRWWLFCTKRGETSNSGLYIYYANSPEGPWTPHRSNPHVNNKSMARPAGYLVSIPGSLYRAIQKNDKSYGEAVNITRVKKLTTQEFEEEFIKELRLPKDEYSHGFHTLNGLGDLTVVDGLKIQFTPLRRIVYEIRNRIKR